jgi:hypothetical protein
MSCGLALALALMTGDAAAAAAPTIPAAAVPAALAQEPLYAEIVQRAKSLHLRVKSAETNPQADAGALKAEVEALAALDMQGHFDLKARNVDGDLKCILKGIAEDLPKRLEDLAAARDPNARSTALKEMGYLLNDNVEVVTAPPGPATPPPAS